MSLFSRLLALYLEEPNFVPLHAGYRVARSIRRLFAQAVSRLLGGTQEDRWTEEDFKQRVRERLDRLEQHLDRIDQRLDRIEGHGEGPGAGRGGGRGEERGKGRGEERGRRRRGG